MEDAVVFPVVRLEADGYSVPAGSHGIPVEKMTRGAFVVRWLPPRHGVSSPVAAADVAAAGELLIPVELFNRLVGAPEPYVRRAGWFSWEAVFPAAPGEGMATASGPFLTRRGARRAVRRR